MKLNKKGFTLVELIVVMAIIAVLAAILVPTMLGFMNNAKYTQANANAKTIYTAVNSVVADYCTDNAALGSSTTANVDSAALGSFAIGACSQDMTSFLDGMTGKGFVMLNDSGTGVAFSTWSLSDPGATRIKKSAQKANTAKDADGNVIGCYPLDTAA